MSEPFLPPPTGTPAAGVGVRFGARFLDGLIVGIPSIIVLGILGFEIGGFIAGVVLTAIQVAYYTVMETGGQTVGKRLLGLKVQGPDGGNPTQQQAFTRNAWLLLGVIPLIGGLASLVIAIWIAVGISQSGRGPHDGWAGGTLVVKA